MYGGFALLPHSLLIGGVGSVICTRQVNCHWCTPKRIDHQSAHTRIGLIRKSRVKTTTTTTKLKKLKKFSRASSSVCFAVIVEGKV